MISVDNITVRFGGFELLSNISFLLQSGDRVGLVGRNGTGKTTLMRLITGEMQASEGKINYKSDLTIGYLPQHLNYSDTTTVFEEVKSTFSEIFLLYDEEINLNKELVERNDYESESYLDLCDRLNELNERLSILGVDKLDEQIERTLLGLGFIRSDFLRNTSEFSGGWRMRIELAKILLKRPMLLLLDEPTNHLDLPAIQWLEEFLTDYYGAVLLVSHDRVFLDTVTNRTIEISLSKIHDYKVSYSKFVELSEERRKQQLAAWENQQKYIKDTEEFIDKFRYKATKAVQVQSRIKQLDKLDRLEVEKVNKSAMRFRFPPAIRSGDIVVEIKDVTKQYGELTVFQDINLLIERGEKVAFVGRNGEGKTTLSRIIVNEIDYTGYCKLGHNVHLGYYAQNQHLTLNEDKTVFDTLDEIAVGDVRGRLKDILGSFLFSGEDIDKKVKLLSGGEKSRLAMARLLLFPVNLLVMDEPTNHLDMISKDVLKNALKQYDGTLIVVSHDRDFLNDLVGKVVEFGNKRIREFPGTIFEFLDTKKLESLRELENKKKITAKNVKNQPEQSQKNDYIERKELERQKRKIQNRISKCEVLIAEKEKLILITEGKLSDPSIYSEEMHNQLINYYDSLKKEVDDLLNEWENLSNEIQQFD